MITVGSTWMDLYLFKLHSSFSEIKKKPQEVVEINKSRFTTKGGGCYGKDKYICGRI